MREIDNGGRGNCMYYAYAISLMYFLRQKDNTTQSEIFKKLRLTENDVNELGQLINDKNDVICAFTDSDIKVIERILGPACRVLAGDHTKEEFLLNPAGSSTFAALAFGIADALKNNLPPGYHRLFPIVDSFNTQADIFKVRGIWADIHQFVKEQKSIFEERRGFCLSDPTNQLTEEQIMDEFIQEQTILFFMKNEQRQLNNYISHLKKDTIWGSEETLLSLHRAITGEKRTENNQWIADIEVSLLIMKNGRAAERRDPEQCNIVLNNQNNLHWVSSISSRYIASEAKIAALIEFKCALEKIMNRLRYQFPNSVHLESDARIFLKALEEKMVTLNNCIEKYSKNNMNRLLNDFTDILNMRHSWAKFLERKYFGEHLYHFINHCWYLIKVAFAALVYIVNPDMLAKVLANKPVEYGLKNDLKRAHTLFGNFKPEKLIENEGNVQQIVVLDEPSRKAC